MCSLLLNLENSNRARHPEAKEDFGTSEFFRSGFGFLFHFANLEELNYLNGRRKYTLVRDLRYYENSSGY